MSVVIVPEQSGVYSSAVDPDHAVGSIRRVGGGAYVFVGNDGSDKVVAPDYDAAVAIAEQFVVDLEKRPEASQDTLELKKALATIADLQARIRELEAKAGQAVTVEAADGIKLG